MKKFIVIAMLVTMPMASVAHAYSHNTIIHYGGGGDAGGEGDGDSGGGGGDSGSDGSDGGECAIRLGK